MPSRLPAPRSRASRRWRRIDCGRSAPSSSGEFLDGLEIDRNPAFNGWLTAQRRRFRGCHAALLEHLAATATGDELFGYLEKWLELAPFDPRVHESLLTAFGRRGRIREGEEHLAATARMFDAEGLDHTPIRDDLAGGQGASGGPARAPAAAASPARSVCRRRDRARRKRRQRRPVARPSP